MVSGGHAWWAWFLPFIFGAPWIVAIAWYWKRAGSFSDGYLRSTGEMARDRLWTRR